MSYRYCVRGYARRQLTLPSPTRKQNVPPGFDYAPRSDASALFRGTFNKSLLDATLPRFIREMRCRACDATLDSLRREILLRRFIMLRLIFLGLLRLNSGNYYLPVPYVQYKVT